MSGKSYLSVFFAALILLVGANGVGAQQPLGDAFTYQGHLSSSGSAVNDTCDFQFSLWDSASSSTGQVGSTQAVSGVAVTNGLFIVQLDFGSNAFGGDARWLEVAVRCPAGAGAYTALSPRQELTATPYALHAASAGSANTLPRPGLSFTPFPDANDIGSYASMTLGADGLGLISFYDATHGVLKVAHCEDIACTRASISRVDGDGAPGGTDVGQYSAIAIGSDGLGLISYYDAVNGDLKVAHCSDVTCTSATTTVYAGEAGRVVGQHTSIAIAPNGLGVISFHAVTDGDLYLAYCNDVACTSLAIVNLHPSDVGMGQYSSITFDANGGMLISYYYAGGGDLYVSYCATLPCDGTNVSYYLVDSVGDVGKYSSITTAPDGYGIIVYADNTLNRIKTAKCHNYQCSNLTLNTAVSGAEPFGFITLAMGSNGLPVFAYSGVNSNDLWFIYCGTMSCSPTTAGAFPSGSAFLAGEGAYASMAIGIDGLPLIAWREGLPADLGVYHCANVFCKGLSRSR